MPHYRAKKFVRFLHGLYDFCNACGGGLHENCKSSLLVFTHVKALGQGALVD